MHTSKKAHIYYPLLGVLVIAYTLVWVVWAINTQSEWWKVIANTSTKINVHADCREVASPNYDIFVPTNTANEWNAFKANKPADVYVWPCDCAIGGSAVYDWWDGSVTWRIMRFDSTQTVNINCPTISFEYLIVWGGGSWGKWWPWSWQADANRNQWGGGWGGSVKAWTFASITSWVYTVTVGAGGAAVNGNTAGNPGGYSNFNGVTAYGWGGGGWDTSWAGTTGWPGGGGLGNPQPGPNSYIGGSAATDSGGGGGAGTHSEWNCCRNSGGGGGAGGAGWNASFANGGGGGGGAGVCSSISNTYTCYGGGGAGRAAFAGWSRPAPGPGGWYGAYNDRYNATSGTDWLWWGWGWGSMPNSSSYYAGAGGRWVVYLRYPIDAYLVSFNGNGWSGHNPVSKWVKKGMPVWLLPSAPTRAGYIFTGWYTASSGWTKIDANRIITANTTFYAQWSTVNPWSCQSVWTTYTALTTKAWCDTADKLICTWAWQWYVWSMCDQWASTIGSEWVLYQWWRNNAAWLASWGNPGTISWPTTLANANANVGSFITTAPHSDWLNTYDNNRLGGNWTTYNAGTYSDRTAGDQSLMTWPCPSWYHVPTIKEWCDTMSALGAPYCDATPAWYEAGGEYYSNTSVRSNLSFTLGGIRANNSSWLFGDGTNSVYWTSSPYGSYYAYAISIQTSQIWYGYDDRADGFSVRCVRNN